MTGCLWAEQLFGDAISQLEQEAAALEDEEQQRKNLALSPPAPMGYLNAPLEQEFRSASSVDSGATPDSHSDIFWGMVILFVLPAFLLTFLHYTIYRYAFPNQRVIRQPISKVVEIQQENTSWFVKLRKKKWTPIRTEPKWSQKKIGWLKFNREYKVIERRNSWTKIEWTNSQAGWVRTSDVLLIPKKESRIERKQQTHYQEKIKKGILLSPVTLNHCMISFTPLWLYFVVILLGGFILFSDLKKWWVVGIGLLLTHTMIAVAGYISINYLFV